MISSLHQPPQQQNLPFWTPFAVIQAQPLPAQIGGSRAFACPHAVTRCVR